jgi:hypothetical protein
VHTPMYMPTYVGAYACVFLRVCVFLDLLPSFSHLEKEVDRGQRVIGNQEADRKMPLS